MNESGMSLLGKGVSSPEPQSFILAEIILEAYMKMNFPSARSLKCLRKQVYWLTHIQRAIWERKGKRQETESIYLQEVFSSDQKIMFSDLKTRGLAYSGYT